MKYSHQYEYCYYVVFRHREKVFGQQQQSNKMDLSVHQMISIRYLRRICAQLYGVCRSSQDAPRTHSFRKQKRVHINLVQVYYSAVSGSLSSSCFAPPFSMVVNLTVCLLSLVSSDFFLKNINVQNTNKNSSHLYERCTNKKLHL